MPFWPFKKRRRSTLKDADPQPLNEKASSQLASEIPRKASKRGGQRKRPASQEGGPPEDIEKREAHAPTTEKENRPPTQRPRTSIDDDITALPMSRTLDRSPHLRPVDVERPAIPYKFRPISASQTSLQRQDMTSSPRRPNTLKSRRSGHESITPQRRRSSKKRNDDHLREEEIRAMSAPIPIPKRPGEGPLRRDSKKMRGVGAIGSVVSLPHGESIHSTMSGFEQRGWEIGMFDVFNPRPAVRLSGTPQYVAPSSVPNAYSSPLATPRNDKQKKPETRDSARKRETIGNRADDFDASDLRMLLERDAKRRERRKKVQQEKLDEKLRDRGGRNRADSDKRRHEREAEEERRAGEARRRAEQEATERKLTSPAAIHPALRNQPAEPEDKTAGLGIDEGHAAPGAEGSDKQVGEVEPLEEPSNPFSDDHAQQLPTPKSEELPAIPGAFVAEPETPMEDPVVDTAREVRLSQASTPPLSPVQSRKGTPSISQVIDPRRVSDLPPPPPITENRRAPDPKPEKKAGAWATLFKRGGTFARRQNEGGISPSEGSFSNTSRESMRNQPLPAHLVGTQAPPDIPRSKSSTPARTQSKFREDLPELPMSPPDSRMPSPDVNMAVATAAAAAARRASKTQPMDIPGSRGPDNNGAARNDTPMSPVRGHGLMSASLASIDSEGSWLASGSTKRQSTQSALSRDIGSLSRHKEFNASYEELGGDKDAEYLRKNTPSPDSKRALRGHSYTGPAMSGASPDEESELNFDDSQVAGEPVAMHGSVRRKPTLVTRDPRVRSREGLLTEYTAESGLVETPPPTSAAGGDGSPIDFDPDAPEPELKSASSVNYGRKGHARQVSAGSAKLLQDVKRQSSQGVPPHGDA